jgi:hypothetical protein
MVNKESTIMPKKITKVKHKHKLVVESKKKNIGKEIVDAMFDLGLPIESMLKEADNLEPNIPRKPMEPIDSNDDISPTEEAQMKLKAIKTGIVEY